MKIMIHLIIQSRLIRALENSYKNHFFGILLMKVLHLEAMKGMKPTTNG